MISRTASKLIFWVHHQQKRIFELIEPTKRKLINLTFLSNLKKPFLSEREIKGCCCPSDKGSVYTTAYYHSLNLPSVCFWSYQQMLTNVWVLLLLVVSCFSPIRFPFASLAWLAQYFHLNIKMELMTAVLLLYWQELRSYHDPITLPETALKTSHNKRNLSSN